MDAGYGWLAVLAVVNTAVSLFYYLRVLGPAYLAEPAGAVPVLGGWAGVSALAAAAGVLAVGLAAEPLLASFANTLLLP